MTRTVTPLPAARVREALAATVTNGSPDEPITGPAADRVVAKLAAAGLVEPERAPGWYWCYWQRPNSTRPVYWRGAGWFTHSSCDYGAGLIVEPDTIGHRIPDWRPGDSEPVADTRKTRSELVRIIQEWRKGVHGGFDNVLIEDALVAAGIVRGDTP